MFLDSFLPLCNFSCINFSSLCANFEAYFEKQQSRNFGNQLATSWQPLRNWQTVGNQLATIANFANCWQPVRNIAKFASHNTLYICELRFSHKTSKSLAKFRIANFANSLANFATTLPNSQSPCQIRNCIAKFAISLPNSQSIAKFAKIANTLRSVCEIFNFRPLFCPPILFCA